MVRHYPHEFARSRSFGMDLVRFQLGYNCTDLFYTILNNAFYTKKACNLRIIFI